jgi:hypothetical protein
VALEDSNVHRIPMPITLMDTGQHFEGNCVNNMTGEEDMPRNLLHDVVLNSHWRCPNIRI